VDTIMTSGYFHRINAETPTRFWVNNPSGADMDHAIAAGAINCTTNPAYCSKLLKSDPDYLHQVVDRVVEEISDDDLAADQVYQQVSCRVIEKFRPLYEESDGAYGYVTMQGDPRVDEDPTAIVQAALRYRNLGKNLMTKIPVIPSGLEAIEAAVAENIPVCATEVFTLAQAVRICELYEQAVKRSGNRPIFFVTHISGIFDEYLEKVAKREAISISPAILAQAGCAIARKQYKLLKERGYHATLLGGGARGTHHFTELVGGDLHITINWSTAQQLVTADGAAVSRIDVETPQPVVDELCDKFVEFRQAFYEDGLTEKEFSNFGPLRLFRNSFLNGWYLLLAEVTARRHARAL
jgi:transaldolase